MKENTNTRLSKKFFVVGKVYDTAIMTDQEIKRIQYRKTWMIISELG